MREQVSVSVFWSGAKLRHRVDGRIVEELYVGGRWWHVAPEATTDECWFDGPVKPVPGVVAGVAVEELRGECSRCRLPVRLIPWRQRGRGAG